MKSPTLTRLLLLSSLFALSLGQAACNSDAAPDETTCNGVTVSAGDDTVCVMTKAQALSIAVDPASLVYITETGAMPMGWLHNDYWRDVDLSGLCRASGFSFGAPRGALAVCSNTVNWDGDTELRILKLASTDNCDTCAPVGDAAEWQAACTDWCDSACADTVSDDAVSDDAECVSACAYGTAQLYASLGAACGDAQTALNACDAADECAFGGDEACADELATAATVCWACEADADCPTGTTCNAGQCAVQSACVEDAAFASVWTPDPIDDDFTGRFPATYGVTPGRFTGDDSEGFIKSRDDGLVVFQIEVGPGSEYERATYDALPTAAELGYESQLDIAGAYDCAPGALYYNSAVADVRDVAGLFITWDSAAGTFTDMLFVSYNVSAQTEVEQVLSTITR